MVTLSICDKYHGSYILESGHLSELTADLGVVSLISVRSHNPVEIDHEIISTVILLLPLIQVGLLSAYLL